MTLHRRYLVVGRCAGAKIAEHRFWRHKSAKAFLHRANVYNAYCDLIQGRGTALVHYDLIDLTTSTA